MIILRNERAEYQPGIYCIFIGLHYKCVSVLHAWEKKIVHKEEINVHGNPIRFRNLFFNQEDDIDDIVSP